MPARIRLPISRNLLPDDSSQPSEAHANTPEANAEDGAISPSQGNSVFDNKADQTMEDLLAQIRLALPVSNGSWSVYICDLSGGQKAPSMIFPCRRQV